ncbi:hypothetical protein, partial [Escherichia coli]|uniref:hypothetical protein n=1 Tax=Escherichia coli TaxID=562 RepID=UPI0010CB46B8
PLDSFRLEPDATATGNNENEKEGTDSVSIHFNSTKIEISSALNSTDMRLVWPVPYGPLRPVPYTNPRSHETDPYLICLLLSEKKQSSNPYVCIKKKKKKK